MSAHADEVYALELALRAMQKQRDGWKMIAMFLLAVAQDQGDTWETFDPPPVEFLDRWKLTMPDHAAIRERMMSWFAKLVEDAAVKLVMEPGASGGVGSRYQKLQDAVKERREREQAQARQAENFGWDDDSDDYDPRS